MRVKKISHPTTSGGTNRGLLSKKRKVQEGQASRKSTQNTKKKGTEINKEKNLYQAEMTILPTGAPACILVAHASLAGGRSATRRSPVGPGSTVWSSGARRKPALV